MKVIKQKSNTKGANFDEYGESRRGQKNALMMASTLDTFEILRKKSDLMEEILQRANMLAALKRVRKNKGSPGVDGMTIGALPEYLKGNWSIIKEQILGGKYKPKPLLRVEIPKSNGKQRQLGIPTVMDRLIQQAITQVLSKYIDANFSSRSFGFRPNKSAHQAIKTAVEEIKGGNEVMLDIDIERFFDCVNHDRLMSKLKEIIADQRLLDMIRRYLNTGVKIEAKIEKRREGVPQGSPLSPFLSNIYLHDLDLELTHRGHKFVRYADDCKIFIRTNRSAQRVMTSIKLYLLKHLKLSINESKYAIGRTGNFLGFVISKGAIRVTKENIAKFKDEIRNTIKIRGGRSLSQVIGEANLIIDGWREYFKIQTTVSVFSTLDGWIRRRIRGLYYTHLKNGKKRYAAFIKSGVDPREAYQCAHSSKGPWVNSNCSAMRCLLNNRRIQEMGLSSLAMR